jgi:ABC-2 type transport system permease protein
VSPVALKTLFIKEVRRFSKVWLQTVLSPLVTTSLYFLVFGVALGSRLREISGVPYIQFVVPGLVMMTMIRDSFLNTSSSLFQSKINGTITDILVAPIGALEMLLAYVGAAMIRAMIVGSLVYLVALTFTWFPLHHIGWTVFFAVFVTATLAMLGMVAALWAEKFDHLAIFPNFVLLPGQRSSIRIPRSGRRFTSRERRGCSHLVLGAPRSRERAAAQWLQLEKLVIMGGQS